MPKALEMITDREGEATKITDAAKAEAQMIMRKAEEGSPRVLAEAYEEAIAAAEQEAAQIKRSARERAEFEAKTVLQDVERQMRSLQEKTKGNVEAAVKVVLAEIL